MTNCLKTFYYIYKNHTKVNLDREKQRILKLLINDSLQEYQKLKDFPNILLKKICKKDKELYFKIFDQSWLPIAIDIAKYENKLISWCFGKFDKEYSKLLKDSKSKNEIEEVKNVNKVHKKEKERSSQNNGIEIYIRKESATETTNRGASVKKSELADKYDYKNAKMKREENKIKAKEKGEVIFVSSDLTETDNSDKKEHCNSKDEYKNN